MELSVLIGFGGGVKRISWDGVRRGTAVCQLRKILPTSASSVDATICFWILHFVWIGPFACD